MHLGTRIDQISPAQDRLLKTSRTPSLLLKHSEKRGLLPRFRASICSHATANGTNRSSALLQIFSNAAVATVETKISAA